MENDAIQLRDVSRVHGTGHQAVTALAQVSLDFPQGTFTAVMGPLRLRQVHPAAMRRRTRPAHLRHRHAARMTTLEAAPC